MEKRRGKSKTEKDPFGGGLVGKKRMMCRSDPGHGLKGTNVYVAGRPRVCLAATSCGLRRREGRRREDDEDEDDEGGDGGQ